MSSVLLALLMLLPLGPAGRGDEIDDAIASLEKAIKEKAKPDMKHFVSLLGDKYAGAKPEQKKAILKLDGVVLNQADQELKVGLYGAIKPVDDEGPQTWKVYCLDKRDGRLRWEQTAASGAPRIKRHTKSTHANSTLAADAKRIVAMFGSEGLYAFDWKGKPLWKKDLGVLDSGFYMVPPAQWGFGSSPILHDDKVFVLADVQKDAFLAAFDAATGRELWRTPRADVPTWGTPTIVEADGAVQVVVNGWKHIGAYDAATGRELWKMTGLGDIPVPTPVFAHGLVFITNAHGPGAPVKTAIPAGTR